MATSDSTSHTIEIPLTKGLVTTIDEIDADLSNQSWWSHTGNGQIYAGRRSRRNGKVIVLLMHRVILERKLGRQLLPNEIADHINGNRLDNRRSNLRVASHSENCINRGIGKNNTSGYKGVSKTKWSWRAKINCGKVCYYLGSFKTAEEAYAAYCEAAKKLHGEFARLD